MATFDIGQKLVIVFSLLAYVSIGNEAQYQANTNGFLTSFNRSAPLVLLRTSMGIQMLTGNG